VTKDPLARQIVIWQGKPSHTIPSQNTKGERPRERKELEGRDPSDVLRTDNMSLTLLSYSAARPTRSRRASFHLLGVYCSYYARHMHVIASPWSSFLVLFLSTFHFCSISGATAWWPGNNGHLGTRLKRCFPSPFLSPLGSQASAELSYLGLARFVAMFITGKHMDMEWY
jgi:hypothetical protein